MRRVLRPGTSPTYSERARGRENQIEGESEKTPREEKGTDSDTDQEVGDGGLARLGRPHDQDLIAHRCGRHDWPRLPRSQQLLRGCCATTRAGNSCYRAGNRGGTVIAVCSESSYRRQAQRCCPSVPVDKVIMPYRVNFATLRPLRAVKPPFSRAHVL